MFILNNNIDTEKSILLSKIFKAYIEEKINCSEFYEFSEVLNRLFLQDINTLKEIYNEEKFIESKYEKFRLDRLVALGLIYLKPKVKTLEFEVIEEWDEEDENQESLIEEEFPNAGITDYGRKFIILIL